MEQIMNGIGAILAFIAIVLLLSIPVFAVYSEYRSSKEFRKALEQLDYEDALNDISALIKSRLAESTKIKKIREVLNNLKKKNENKGKDKK